MLDRIKNTSFLNRFRRMQLVPPPRVRENLDGVAVLTPGAIYDFTPATRNQQRVATCNARGGNTPVYSTGRLEQAVSEQFDVWVVTSRHELEPSDEWWTKLLPSGRVLTLYERSSGLMEPWLILLLTLMYELDPSAWPEEDELNALAFPDDVQDILARLGVELVEYFEGFSRKGW